MKNATAGI